MKRSLKVLSLIFTIVMLIGTISVGMSAYAVSDDVIGDYDFEITNVYKDIDWSNVGVYKGETHVHTVRSDADTEIDDMILEYYRLGFDALALTDHGTINYGWTNDQSRIAIFEYQYFVHGPTDELSEAQYKSVITGTRERSINSGKGMMEIPLGIELNGMSTIKCHVNGFYADADHGGIGMAEDWPLNAVVKNYNAGGFTHINHVGEWSEGNDDASVYSASWLTRFTSIFENYCPNRGGRGSEAQTNWMDSHKGEAGCIGMELVNTADSRTHNDRRFVYDEILKRLAPQGINVFGFCEDDAHEYSDCDRNAQFFLINKDKNVAIDEAKYNASNKASGENTAYKNDNNDPMDKVQNYYRDAMFYGEFITSSKNAKNSYELGNGFVAAGDYPTVSNIQVDQEKNQIAVTIKDATKVRMVADGEVIETVRTSTASQTVVFDLNRNESKINGYVRIYLTGAGGITFLQPFLVKKVESAKTTVQFLTPTTDTEIVVKDSTGAVVSENCKYENFYYVLPAGDYTYTASRRGFETKENVPFTVDEGDSQKIPVELEEKSDVSYAYFYAPETIYLDPSDNQTFAKYIDRENAVNGALHNEPQAAGNIFFYREGATDLELQYDVIEGKLPESITVASTKAGATTLATQITAGKITSPVPNNEHVLIKWTMKYTYNDIPYEAYTYSYVYSVPSNNNSILAAGGFAKTKKNITTWAHSEMYLAASLYVTGIHKLVTVGSDSNVSYKYAPNTGYTLYGNDTNPIISGTGMRFKSNDSSGGSAEAEVNNTDNAYIYADRSRINNWSEIPYFAVGLDLNAAVEVNDKNNAADAAVRLGFDASINDVKNNVAAKRSNLLYALEFSSQTNFAEIVDYNISDGANYDTRRSGTQSNSLAGIGPKRLYLSDNADSAKKIVYPLPPASAQESVIPISAYVIGYKEGRSDHTALEVNVTVVNINKDSLRKQFNDTVKESYQKDWFASDADWDTYQATVVKAAKLLGNPVAEAEELETAVQDLQDIVDNFVLKSGTMVVKHYWEKDGNTGLIYSEAPIVYEYSNDLSANAAAIAGYTFANKYECYSEGTKIDEGIADFDLAFAEKPNYEWRFYYTPNEYNVTYDTMGAGAISSYAAKASYGQSYTVSSETPQKTGYTFDGWYLDNTQKTYSAGATFNWNYAGDGEFKAQWTSNKYTVSYDFNGGSSVPVPDDYKTVSFGETYSLISAVPAKTGYAFAGWQLNGGNIYTSGSNVFWDIAADSTFVAQWEVAEFKVTFDKVAADASLSFNEKTVMYDVPYGTLPEATRNGYTVEWYADPSYATGTKVTASTNVAINADHTLYAKWNPIDYTITYNLNGGAVSGNNPTTYNIETGDIALKAPTRAGYKFIGWTSPDFAGMKTSYTIPAGSTGAKTFTANWELSGYTINYNLDGGQNNANNPSSYKVSDTVTLLAPTKKGYRFVGWTGDNGSVPETTVTIAAGSTGEKSYTANWEIETYTITYDYDGATTTPTNPTSYTVNTATFTLENPERFGYTFSGWTCNNDALSGKNVTITKGAVTGNLTFKAIWAENGAHTVSYVLNGGKVEGSNPASYKDGDSFSIVNPTKDGYTFAGWVKTVGSASEAATKSAKILATDADDITFTATWNVIDYTINYNLNGGRIASAQTNPASYNAESAAITLVAPVRAGYTFNGWTGTGLSSATKVVTIETGSTGNRNYTASWKANDYTITYNLNGGADAGFRKSYTSATNATIGAPVRAGYTFTGWSVAFTNFTWNSGTISADGKFAAKSNSFYSDGIVLRSGNTYNLTGAVSDVKMYAFDKSGALIGTFTTSITPSKDCVVYIVADNQSSADSLRATKLELAGATPTSFALTAETADIFGNAGNMEMTANWSDDTYTITYVYDSTLSWGVDSEGKPLADPNPTTYKYSSSDILLKNPSKTGYTFTGWEYNGVVSPSTVIKSGSTGNRTYTAVIARTEYNITYTGIDGATVSGNPATYNVDSSDITLNNPTKTGYVFEGWVGTGLSSASKSVKIEKGSTGDKTFIATWTPVAYAISYKGIEGATVSNPNSYTIETDTFTLKNPAKAGAVFTGWEDESGATLANVTINKGTTGNKSYTAVWSYTDYTITYDLAGGTETTNPTAYKVTSADITLNAPTRAGYTFTGWTGIGLDAKTTSVVIKSGSTGNRNYTANWQVINYSISYDLAGGQVAQNANPTSYNIESATITLVNPVKAGFKFAGWTGTGHKEAAMEVTIPHGSKDNRTYTATWVEDGYTITYTGLEGATLSSENRTFYTVATNDFTLNNPEKRGYTFVGWSGTGITGSGISNTVTVPKGSTGNRSYEANWSLDEYVITYDFTGGSEGGIKNPRSYNINTAPFSLYAPVKTGYNFVGWESDYYDGTLATVTIDPNETVGDKNFVAVWSTGNYTITLDTDGGTLPAGQASTISYNYNTPSFTIMNPTKSGYDFAGWIGSGLTSKTVTLSINQGSTGDRSYKAVWISSSQNKITYNLNGGEVLSGANPESYVINSGSILLKNPTKEGYKFNGWVVEQESKTGIITLNGKYATINTSLGGSAYISADWSLATYKITYNLNGGTNAGTNPKTYTINDAFTLDNPTRPGYTFKGWTGTDLDDAKPSTNVSVANGTGNRTYTAHWGEAEYSITYDYNGGSATVANPTSFNVLTPSFTLNNPEKAGYTFTGWTGSNGTTPQKTVTIAAGSSGAKNYTANFEIETYTITYYGVDKDPQTYTVESADINIANPTKAGYEFMGWQHKDAINPEKNVVVRHGSTGDKEFTAIWKETEYKITYVLDGGEVSGTNPETYTIESSKITLLNPTKAGYEFLGWNTSDGKTNQMLVEIPKGSTGNKTFTAKWGLAPYKIIYQGIPASVVEDLKLPTSYTADASVTIKNPVMAGYTFAGWTGTDLTAATKNLVIPAGSSGNKIYKATWTMDNYTITVDYNGGTSATTVPATYTVDSADIDLGIPVKEGYTFTGWTGSNGTTPEKFVTIKTGSVGNRYFKANWAEGSAGDTHKFYFKGYADAKLYVAEGVENGKQVHYDYIEVPVGTPVNIDPASIDTTAGYKITGWDIDLNDPQYVNSYEDVIVHAKCSYGDEKYTITANGTTPVTKTYSQYEKVSVTTDYSQGNSLFCYWVEAKVGADGSMQPGEIVSYYRNYTFYAHTNVVLMAVYGAGSDFVRATTRVSRIEEYDPNYDWVTINSERSIGPEYTLVQHGVLFTTEASSGTESGLVIGGSKVYKAVAKTKNLNGNWAVSIPNPYSFGTGKTFYIRSYIIFADEDGNKTTIYSAIKTYVNNEDITPN